jgi:hypothetical protein
MSVNRPFCLLFITLTKEDLRALTPLIYNHINPYGNFELNMDERIPILK